MPQPRVDRVERKQIHLCSSRATDRKGGCKKRVPIATNELSTYGD